MPRIGKRSWDFPKECTPVTFHTKRGKPVEVIRCRGKKLKAHNKKQCRAGVGKSFKAHKFVPCGGRRRKG